MQGLEPSLLAALADASWPREQHTSSAPRRLLYLSCGWMALKRDTAALLGLAPAPFAASGKDTSESRRRTTRQNKELQPSQHRQQQQQWVQLRAPRWRLVSATAFLFFPGTDSIETLAVFEELPAPVSRS
jgi:hypothetical protein